HAGEGQKPSPFHPWVEIENHRNDRRISPTAISRHTASKFYSPVVFALRTHPLRRGGNVTRITRRIHSSQQRRIAVANKTVVNFCISGEEQEVLPGHLFGEHIPVVRDTAIQRHGSEVSALRTFRFSPGAQGRN